MVAQVRKKNLNYYKSLPEYRFSASLLDDDAVGGTVMFDALQLATTCLKIL